MDKATLDLLATVVSETLEAFLNAHADARVHAVTLTYQPASSEESPYYEMSVTQTVTVIHKADAPQYPVEETLGSEQPPLGVFNEPREQLLSELESHINESENNTRRGIPPLTEEARLTEDVRRARAVADALLAKQK